MLNKMIEEIRVIKGYGYNMEVTKRLIEGAYNVKISTLAFWKIYTGRLG